MTFNFTSGRYSLVENGIKWWDATYDSMVKFGAEKKGSTANMATLGCGSGWITTRGRVTDMQVYSRVLTDTEMVNYTACRTKTVDNETDMAYDQGDIISWERNRFTLNGTTAELETLDLEDDVCRNMKTNSSLVFVPVKQDFTSGLHMCTKFSGKVAGYITEEEFNTTLELYMMQLPMKKSVCSWESTKDEFYYGLYTWLASTDEDVEGEWRDSYTDKLVQHQPWASGRPWTGT